MFLLLVLIIFAIISSYFGCFILWNKITNYFDSFGHSAIFAASIASIFHLSEISSLIIFSFIFSSLLFTCMFFNIKLNNTLLIVLSSAFIASGIMMNDFHRMNHQHSLSDKAISDKIIIEESADKENLENKHNHDGDHSHDDSHETKSANIEKYVGCIHENDENNFFDFLIGMPLQKWPLKQITTILSILLGIFAISLFFVKNWLINIINKNLYYKKTIDRVGEFAFLIIIGFFAIIMVKFSGVLFSVSLSIFPALIAHYFKKGPIQTIIIAASLNVMFTLIGFFILKDNQAINFNIILLALQFITFISVSSIKKIRGLSFMQ